MGTVFDDLGGGGCVPPDSCGKCSQQLNLIRISACTLRAVASTPAGQAMARPVLILDTHAQMHRAAELDALVLRLHVESWLEFLF